MSIDTREAADKLLQQLLPAEMKTSSSPVLVMLSGLPGTGKSHLARILAQRLPAIIVASDWVRKMIFMPPTYSAEESAQTHHLCHILIQELLRRGANVIYDATNLQEEHRQMVYVLADKAEAKLVIVQTVAPEEVVRERLEHRPRRPEEPGYSDADWQVYRRMLRKLDRDDHFGRNYIVVNTAEDIEPAIRKIMRVIRRTGVRRV